MSELWYWKTSTRTHGPLVTDELAALVASGRLSDSDQVRLDGHAEWIPASEIRTMFAGPASEASPAQTAADLLKSQAVRRLQASAVAPRSRRRWVPSVGLDVVTNAVGAVASAVAWLLAEVSRWLGRRGRTVLTVAGAVIVLAFVVSEARQWMQGDLTRLREIRSVWVQIRNREFDQKATSGSSLTASETTWLKSTLGELEQLLNDHPVSGAGSNNARRKALARREMLFAVRTLIDRTPRMAKSEDEHIDRALEAATGYLAGESRVSPTVHISPTLPETRRVNETLIMIVIDGVLVFAFIAWVIWRRRR